MSAGPQQADMEMAMQNFIVRAGEILADGLFTLCFNHARFIYKEKFYIYIYISLKFFFFKNYFTGEILLFELVKFWPMDCLHYVLIMQGLYIERDLFLKYFFFFNSLRKVYIYR